MTNQISLESLLQRGRSKLFDQLSELCSDTQNALRDTPKAKKRDINLHLKQFGFAERLKHIVETNMGITLDRVSILEMTLPNAMASLFVIGESNRMIKSREHTLGTMVETLNRVYDDRAGKITASVKKKPFGFGLDISTAYWQYRNRDGSYYFTPDEVAAIVLHELGHFDHWIRTIFRANSAILDAADVVDYINSGISSSEALELIAVMRKRGRLSRDWDKIVKLTEAYFKTSPNTVDPLYAEALNTLTLAFASDMSNFTLAMCLNYVTSEKEAHDSVLFEIDAERSADEFSSRNGAYTALTSALFKMNKAFGVKATWSLSHGMWFIPAVIFGTLAKFHTYFDVSAESVASGYDPMMRRLELIIQTAKHAFSDADLPEHTKAYLREQITQASVYLDQYRSAPERQMRLKIKQWTDAISKFGRLIKSPVYDRMRDDYGRLQNATRSLKRNPLYYLANK